MIIFKALVSSFKTRPPTANLTKKSTFKKVGSNLILWMWISFVFMIHFKLMYSNVSWLQIVIILSCSRDMKWQFGAFNAFLWPNARLESFNITKWSLIKDHTQEWCSLKVEQIRDHFDDALAWRCYYSTDYLTWINHFNFDILGLSTIRKTRIFEFSRLKFFKKLVMKDDWLNFVDKQHHVKGGNKGICCEDFFHMPSFFAMMKL